MRAPFSVFDVRRLVAAVVGSDFVVNSIVGNSIVVNSIVGNSSLHGCEKKEESLL